MPRLPLDSKQLYIIEKAMKTEFNKIEDFAEIIGVSTRTIRNYIKQINDTITDKVAQLVYVKDYGYKLEIYNHQYFQEITKEYLLQKNNIRLLNTPEERLSYILKKIINSSFPIKIDDLAEEINVGRTTLINDFKRIAEPLSMYGLIIKGKQNGGIELRGNELNIRLFVLNFLCKNYITNYNAQYYFGSIDELKHNDIKNFLKELFYYEGFIATDETLKELLTYTTVLLCRIKDGRYIINLDEKYDELINTEEYGIAKKIRDKLEKDYKCEINDNEIIFLTLPLIGRKAPINKDRLSNIKINLHVKQLVQTILEEISINMGIDIKYDNELIWSLEYHLNFALNRLIFNTRIKNPLLKEIKNSYPLAYEMGKIAAGIIQQNYNVKVSEDEIGYIALHFGSYIERKNQKSFSIEKVALVCGTGLGTAQLLCIKLKKLLGENKIFKTFSDIELTTELLSKFDVIFSTVDINIETQIPIIKINAIFNEDEIKKEIEKVFYLKKYNYTNFESNLLFLNMAVIKDMFYVLDKETFIENLSFMVEQLTNLGEVDLEFKNRILEREHKAPTAFDNYVALPHTVNYKGNRISLAFGILKKPVFWGGKEVRVIILLMIPKDDVDPELIIKIYEELLKLCQNKRLIENISKVGNYEEFAKLLQKEVII